MDCYRLVLVSVQRFGGDSPVVERRAGDRKVELAKCRSALGKDTLGLFPIRDKQLYVVVAQPVKRLANITPKSALSCCCKAEAECLVLMNKRVERFTNTIV